MSVIVHLNSHFSSREQAGSAFLFAFNNPAYGYSQTVKQTKAAPWKQAASFVLKAEASGSVGCVLDVVNNCFAGILDIASSIVKCSLGLVRLPFGDQMLVTERVPRYFLCLPNCIVDCTLYVFLIHFSPLNIQMHDSAVGDSHAGNNV